MKSEDKPILVVDDDVNVCELVALYLRNEGFAVHTVHDGDEALTHIQNDPPALIVLDLMLPGTGGMDICRTVRRDSDVPIIMLTAKGDDVDRIVGLEMGADDYIAKPFNPRELVARVKAVMRRAGRPDNVRPQQRLAFPGLEIDPLAHVAVVDGREVALTPTEFDLLLYLASREEHALSRAELLENVWNLPYLGEDRTVDVHVKRLRRKIEPEGHPYSYIQTVWGVGYRFKVVPT